MRREEHRPYNQLTYYGAARLRGKNLHLFCRPLGIESTKATGTTGDDVVTLYANKKYPDLARCNAGDRRALWPLAKNVSIKVPV